MRENATISVIVPIYNVENYLKECVDSLLVQSYDNLEILLIDDGSKDKCPTICDEYAQKDNRIKVVHKTNGGLSDARNEGLRRATGEYIGFVDSDDWIEPNMYSLLMEGIIKDQADISICGYYRSYVDKEEKCVDCYNGSLGAKETLTKLFEGVEIHDHSVTKLYKKELWDDIFFPVGKLYEDIRTIYKVIARSNRVSIVGEALYHYRQREGSLIRSGFALNKMQWIESIDEIMNSSIAQESETFIEILKYRRAKDACKILREMMLFSPEKLPVEYELKANELLCIIKKYRAKMVADYHCTKAMKLIAILSIFGIKAVRIVFQSEKMKTVALSHMGYYK